MIILNNEPTKLDEFPYIKSKGNLSKFNSLSGYFWIINNNSTALACILFTKTNCIIKWFEVSIKYRHMHTGSYFFKSIEKLCIKNNINEILLDPKDEDAESFWRYNGFVSSTTDFFLEKNLRR